jgi:hypothetical protein
MEIAKLILEFVKVLVWPSVVLAIVIIFRTKLEAILWRLRKADLPGGVSLDFDQAIQEAKDLSQQVVRQIETAAEREPKKLAPGIPLTQANARMLQLGLRPSPSGLDPSYYRTLVAQDPNLALAGIRIETEILANNLAKGFGIDVSARESGGRLLRKLFDAGAITREQMQLAMKVLALCNAAIHGQFVSREEAEDVIAVTQILMDQYVRWLSWGFADGWQPAERDNTQ